MLGDVQTSGRCSYNLRGGAATLLWTPRKRWKIGKCLWGTFCPNLKTLAAWRISSREPRQLWVWPHPVPSLVSAWLPPILVLPQRLLTLFLRPCPSNLTLGALFMIFLSIWGFISCLGYYKSVPTHLSSFYNQNWHPYILIALLQCHSGLKTNPYIGSLLPLE